MGMSKAQLKALGTLIARERGKRKLTQRDLAREAGMSHPTIFNLERGNFNRPDPEKLQRIARALDLDVEDLFALAGYTPSDGLPNFGPYLRTKLGKELSASDRKKLERYYEQLRDERGKGGRGGSAR
jgi:transcriptional regulator with XRE-family HTH domain